MIHVRFDGRSMDFTSQQLGLPNGANDSQIKHRLSKFLEIPLERLQDYCVDRRPSGTVVVRPHAIYG